ncbi:MAG: PsbP-related protein [Clostridia bacterium]|nr:PsbP-related protein [Clostridia bacterium]
MKRFLCLLLCATVICTLCACGKSDKPDAAATQDANFAPETTAVAGSGLAQAIASVEDSGDSQTAPDEAQDAQPAIQDELVAQNEPVAQDVAIDTPVGADVSEDAAQATDVPDPTSEPSSVQPFATATPQPNTAISGYAEVVGTGLGFRFSYPQGWQNIPGKPTVCFVQPMENGTVYPARVTVTMKKLSHSGSESRLQEQMVSFVEVLQEQYDKKTFEVDTNLDTETGFMGGKRSYATTYLAYDGDQEIKGYVAMTYFDKYVFCFHFQCAYEDYAAFEPAIRHMRDSVKPDEDSLNS